MAAHTPSTPATAPSEPPPAPGATRRLRRLLPPRPKPPSGNSDPATTPTTPLPEPDATPLALAAALGLARAWPLTPKPLDAHGAGAPAAGAAGTTNPPRGSGRPPRLWRFLMPYRGPLALAAGLGLAMTVLELARPWPLKLAVDSALGDQPLTGLLAPLDGLGPGALAAVAAGAALALVAAGALLGYLADFLSGAAAERIGADLREAVFARLLELSIRFHDRHRSGDLVSRLTSDVARVEDVLVAWLTTLAPEVLTLAGMIAVTVAVDPVLGLAALTVLPPLVWAVTRSRRRIRDTQRDARDADAALTVQATDVLRNVRAVQAFGRQVTTVTRFHDRSTTATRAALTAMDTHARSTPAADLLLAAGSGLVLWLGVLRVASGRITLGTLLVVLSYLASLYGPVRALARLARTLARGAASRERVLEVLASHDAVPEDPRALPVPPPAQGLSVRGVRFGYVDGAPVLRDLDLEVAAGEHVCVVGPTGAGKSTLLALLVRLYDPDAGAVELDGVDLRRLRLASLRERLALVPQDPWVLDGTIDENIAFGRPDATPEQIRSAARLALLDEFAGRLPGGFATQVGEGGAMLSGGQRRRVALARALVRDASVLLLDEPTSGLDPAAEAAVLRALERAADGRTVISVSHRLGLAARADRVVVLAGGRVAEAGHHTELLAAGGVYARMWALQHPPDGTQPTTPTPEGGDLIVQRPR